MARPVLFHNPRCAKSREAKALLEDRGVAFDLRFYLDDTPSPDELDKLLRKLGMEPEDLVRRGEAVYKERYKGRAMTRKTWLKALCENPRLIERPILISGRKAVVGRPPGKVLDLIG